MSEHQPLVNQQKLWKTFLIFLLPLIATNILQNLSGTINTVFVGQMLGVHAIAAVAVFFPILFCLMAFVIGLSAGATVLVEEAPETAPPQAARLKAIPAAITKDTMRFIVFSP